VSFVFFIKEFQLHGYDLLCLNLTVCLALLSFLELLIYLLNSPSTTEYALDDLKILEMRSEVLRLEHIEEQVIFYFKKNQEVLSFWHLIGNMVYMDTSFFSVSCTFDSFFITY